MTKRRMTRRKFLYVSAIGIASGSLAACQAAVPTAAVVPGEPKADPTKAPETAPEVKPTEAPVQPPAPEVAAPEEVTFSPKIKVQPKNEAPMLKELVDAGKLPPLAERMPENPLVLKPIHGTGEYGGTIRTLSADLGNQWMQHQYGCSPVRWARDGEEIIPGIFESWESNSDNTVWTFKMSKGLKWSDGQPCTVDDVLFWWEDMVLDEEQPTQPPDWGAVNGKLVKIEKIDDVTLQFTYAGISIFTLQRMANWSKGGVGYYFIMPAHYLKQFHPKYNSEVKDFQAFNEKIVMQNNPEHPTLNPWMVERMEPGVNRVWKRNPYYYVVDMEGNQLPYIDAIDETQAQNLEVQKLKVTQGDIDFLVLHGFFLSDVSLLKGGEKTGNYETRFWDSGSGTGMNYFWNFDHPDDKYREVFRNPVFKRAMSHALDRKTIQKIVYYNAGYISTGTMTPKSIEFTFNEEFKKFYEKARDAYVEYNPEKAKAMLAEAGLKDTNNDGFVEFADGSPFEVRVDLAANAGKECMDVLEITRKNWTDIGLKVVINQMPVAEFNAMWNSGQGAFHTNWEATGTVEQLAFGDWLVPKEPTRWAPLCGNRKAYIGTDKEDSELEKSPWDRTPPRFASTEDLYAKSVVKKMDEIYDVAIMETDPVKRYSLTHQIIQLHIDEGPFLIGTVANYPRIIIVGKNMYNVPTREELAKGGMVNTWTVPSPAMYGPETFSFKKA